MGCLQGNIDNIGIKKVYLSINNFIGQTELYPAALSSLTVQPLLIDIICFRKLELLAQWMIIN